MSDFNPKNVTIGSGIDQNKKLPSFWPIGQKMLILHEKLEFLMIIFHWKIAIFDQLLVDIFSQYLGFLNFLPILF